MMSKRGFLIDQLIGGGTALGTIASKFPKNLRKGDWLSRISEKRRESKELMIINCQQLIISFSLRVAVLRFVTRKGN